MNDSWAESRSFLSLFLVHQSRNRISLFFSIFHRTGYAELRSRERALKKTKSIVQNLFFFYWEADKSQCDSTIFLALCESRKNFKCLRNTINVKNLSIFFLTFFSSRAFIIAGFYEPIPLLCTYFTVPVSCHFCQIPGSDWLCGHPTKYWPRLWLLNFHKKYSSERNTHRCSREKNLSLLFISRTKPRLFAPSSWISASYCCHKFSIRCE